MAPNRSPVAASCRLPARCGSNSDKCSVDLMIPVGMSSLTGRHLAYQISDISHPSDPVLLIDLFNPSISKKGVKVGGRYIG